MAQWRHPQSHRGPQKRSFLRALFSSLYAGTSNAVHPQVALSDISEQSQNSISDAFHIMTEGPPPGASVVPISPQLSTTGERSTVLSQQAGASESPQKLTRSLQLTFPVSHKSGGSNTKPQAKRRGQQRPRRTVARMELENGIKLVRRNIFSRKPWRDGLSVMWIVVTNTVTSLVVAWGVTFLYAMGSPFAPFHPTLWGHFQAHGSEARQQSQVVASTKVVEFYGATGLYFVLFACIVHAVPTAVLASRRTVGFTENRTIRPQGFRRALMRTLVSTWYALLLALAAGTVFMVFLALQHVPFRAYGRMHFYIMCAIAYFYALFADFKMKVARRRMHVHDGHRGGLRSPHSAPTSSNSAMSQREESHTESSASTAILSATVVEFNSHASNITQPLIHGPPASAKISDLPRAPVPAHVPTSPRRGPSRSYRTRGMLMHIAAFNVVFLYLHVASVLRLTEQWELMLFASLSLLLKISIQEAAKRFQLSAARKPSVRAVHLVMTVPTIAIDAQIRMVFIQNGGGQSILASSVAIIFCEIFFRIAKILRLRYSITKRLAECKGMWRLLTRVNSKLSVRDVGAARAEYAEFLDWKNYVLRLHAAEVYADMHGEFISIGMSTAVVIFMGDHPMFDLSASSNGTPDHGQRILAAVFQTTTGLAFDYISSVVEGVHEVPLYESIADEGTSLRIFLHVLLSTITAVNIGVIGLFYIKSF